MSTPVDPADPTVSGQEYLHLAPTGELVLFFAGGMLTLMVMAFVGWLMLRAIREERVARDGDRTGGDQS